MIAGFAEKTGRSEYSFPVYLIHMPFIVSGCVVVFGKTGMPMPAAACMSAVAGLTASLAIRAVLMRSDPAAKFLFGKR